MSPIGQGQVWWANLPQPAGRRPVVVLTRTGAIRALSNVTIAPITRTIRAILTEVLLTPADGVPTECVVSLDNILTIPKSSLDSRLATLSMERLAEIFTAVRVAFAMK